MASLSNDQGLSISAGGSGPEGDRVVSSAGGTSQAEQGAFGAQPEPISDGDMVSGNDDATVDRMARNPSHGLSHDFHGHRPDLHHHDDHHDEKGGWGFRIRNFLLG
jgi:hypothetical protein